MSYRRFERARSLRSEGAEQMLGRYVTTELGSSGTDARSLRNDRACYVATELGSSSVAT
ncbi:hypothetical protein F2Q69_00042285 [Brassica cretica]|uniref:Uncharacterized protein n=1 Tax=Brassica cretica TaxID=69181 RepID=A0A8S9NE74_BRACR|nr:hypothetical protein F2Q69_00042285 [Brassica cretica]